MERIDVDWDGVYSHLPEKTRKKAIFMTKEFDRIGPIKLPLEISCSNVVSDFFFYYFGFFESKQNYFLITKNENLKFSKPLIRISSNCNWAFDFGSKRCDCKWELEHAKELIHNKKNKDGLIIFCLDQHGKSVPGGAKGHSLIYYLGQTQKQDLVNDAYVTNGFKLDYRRYDDVVVLLKFLKIKKFELLTNNPERIGFFENHGFKVLRKPIEKPYEKFDSEELGVKKEKLGHLLKLKGFKKQDIKIYNLDPQKVFG